jgi:hypothetical protein
MTVARRSPVENVTHASKVAERFRGPPNSGNGGYVCGLIARHVEGPARVRLFAPPPLETALEIQRVGDVVRLVDGASVVGEGQPASLTLEPPARPSFEEAERAARSFAGFTSQWFPGCFVCGPDRREHDGLRIFPGPLPAIDAVAAPWVPDASLARGANVGDEFIWAALDCPGAFAVGVKGSPIVLGQLTARIDRCVGPGERCVVIGWPISADGRKHVAGTAILTEAGERVAVAEAIWIEVPASAFQVAEGGAQRARD